MTIDEFEPEDVLTEISRKLSNVSIHKLPTHGGYVDKDILPTVKYWLSSADKDQIKQSIRLLRKYLTQGKSDETSVSHILSLDILPRIKELMTLNYGDTIKFECAWVITNIAAGTTSQTNAIIEAGFIDLLLECLTNENSKLELQAQAAWALGNVAGESPAYRHELMKRNFPQYIVKILNDVFADAKNEVFVKPQEKGYGHYYNEDYFSDIEALLWTLSNMARGGFQVAEYWETYLPMFEVFTKYLTFKHTKVEIEVCWGLSRILFNMHDVTQFHLSNVISDDVCSRLTDLLSTGTPKVVVPVIRTIVNITSGPNHCATGLLRTPLLTSLCRLLDPQAPNEIRKDAYLIISNLAAGDEIMIQHVLDNKTVMYNVIAHITVPGHTYSQNPIQWIPTISNAYYYKNDEWKVTKEALWIIFNITSLGSDRAVRQLLSEHENISHKLAALLNYIDIPYDVCEKVIEALTSLIQRSNKWVNDYCSTSNKNPHVQILLNENVIPALACIKQSINRPEIIDASVKLEKLLLASEEDITQTTSISEGIENLFGLPTIVEIKAKSSKRRVLRTFEDGDVRLIENAVGNLCI